MNNMINISAEEMVNSIVTALKEKKELPRFYWKSPDDGYKKIINIDLLRHIDMEDGDYTYFEWEIEESNIYKEVQDE